MLGNAVNMMFTFKSPSLDEEILILSQFTKLVDLSVMF